ncbi:MAG TPA: hypothetical protein VH393_04840 [Ktedonobacterales bacterium]
MGTDIYGWVEIQHEREDGYRYWRGAIYIRFLVERHYEMFHLLFGRGIISDIPPLAADRGLPDDLSEEAWRDTDYAAVVSPSWIMWSELDAITWEERNGVMVHITDTGAELEDRITLSAGWATLFDMMRLLADRFGQSKIRLVVWFDS